MVRSKDPGDRTPRPLLVLPFMPAIFAVRPRLTGSIAVGLAFGAAVALLAPGLALATVLILGWDAMSLVFVVSMLASMIEHSPADIRARAARDDEGRGVILGLIIVAVAVSLAATALELHLAKQAHGIWQIARVSLAGVTVAASWMMMQLIFGVHYAHEYYAANEQAGGLDSEGLAFPGGEPPDYWDFLHFSIVIGVACQTADIAFTSKPMRRLGTVHGLAAFAFNTVIVALTINLVAGLI